MNLMNFTEVVNDFLELVIGFKMTKISKKRSRMRSAMAKNGLKI